jgi:hypothetical protein
MMEFAEKFNAHYRIAWVCDSSVCTFVNGTGRFLQHKNLAKSPIGGNFQAFIAENARGY